MKRLALLTLALSTAPACIDMQVDWQSALDELLTVDSPSVPANGTLYTQARGVVLHEDGKSAHVGMHGTTCEVDTDGAWIGTDHDLPGDSEVVVDAHTCPDGTQEVLVTTDDGVHVVQRDDWWDDGREDYSVDGTIDAGFTDEGIAVLADDPQDGCGVTWVDRGTTHGARTPVSPDLCDAGASVTVDPDTGDTYVVTPNNGVVRVELGGVQSVGDAGADIAAWDKYAQMLYTAREGQGWVRGDDWHGTTLWQVELGHPVISVHNAGDRHGALVLIDAGSQDQIVFVDAQTGDTHVEMTLPDGALDISVAGNGRDIALIKPNEVYFMRL